MIGEFDNVQPKEKWEFDEQVADCFDNMLERSIPQYDVMRSSVCGLAKYIIDNSHKEHFSILDIGCSNGIMLDRLKQTFNSDYAKFVGIDVSEPMLSKAKYKFLDDIINGKVEIFNCDLRTNFPSDTFDVITSILSIQFTPIEYRQNILRRVYNHLSPKDGAFIMVEKVLGNTDSINQMFVSNYYEMKSNNGYSQEQIDRKRLSLEGVLVPVTNDWNIDLLKQAGFREVDVFWRWMNFVGYIAIK